MDDDTREIALLLDWENIRIGLSQQNLPPPNIGAIREEAASLGRVVVARAYADFQNRLMSEDPSRLYAAGIEPVYVPGRFYQNRLDGKNALVRKNSIDVKLTADCVEFCHRYPNIKAYMLVSGDGDFIHLVNALRPHGKFVAVVALSWSASQRLVESVDLVRYYDLHVEPSMQMGVVEPVAEVKSDPAAPGELVAVFKGMRKIVEEQGRPLVLAALKPILTQRIGDIQERKFGHTKFKPLVMQARDAGYVRVVTKGLVDWVMPVNADFDSVQVDDEEDSEALGFDRDRGYYRQGSEEYLTFETLPEDTRHEIIRFSNSLDLSSRYITFRYLSQNLSQEPWMQLDYNHMVGALNSAVEMGLFTRNTHEDFDVHTGLMRTLPTLELNLDHPQVIEALGFAGASAQVSPGSASA